MTETPVTSPSPSEPVDPELALILQAGKSLVQALGEMFAPSCEVVLHDLTRPEQAIVAIANPISGRKIGDATTELGLERAANPAFPDVVQNYANQFPDGRLAKSTSIGLRASSGRCVAALCLNLDISMFTLASRILDQLAATQSTSPVPEKLQARSKRSVADAVQTICANKGIHPRALSAGQRRDVIFELRDGGYLDVRGSLATISSVLGVSRATIYNVLKNGERAKHD